MVAVVLVVIVSGGWEEVVLAPQLSAFQLPGRCMAPPCTALVSTNVYHPITPAHRHHLLRQKIKIHPITQRSLKQRLVIFRRELCVRENKTSKSLFDPKKWSVGGMFVFVDQFQRHLLLAQDCEGGHAWKDADAIGQRRRTEVGL